MLYFIPLKLYIILSINIIILIIVPQKKSKLVEFPIHACWLKFRWECLVKWFNHVEERQELGKYVDLGYALIRDKKCIYIYIYGYPEEVELGKGQVAHFLCAWHVLNAKWLVSILFVFKNNS